MVTQQVCYSILAKFLSDSCRVHQLLFKLFKNVLLHHKIRRRWHDDQETPNLSTSYYFGIKNKHIFFPPQKDTLCKNANTNPTGKRCSGEETPTGNVQDETHRWKLAAWKRACKFGRSLTSLVSSPKPSVTCMAWTVVLSWRLYTLINMIRSPAHVATSRWNVSAPSWPRSVHLWRATRRFNLDLSRNLTKSSFLDSVASSLRFSLLFSWAAADGWELSFSLGLVLSSMTSPSEAQSNKWRKGRGWPRWACPLSALETIDSS